MTMLSRVPDGRRPKSAKARISLVYPLSPSSLVTPPTGDDWVHEPKWDGFRLHAIEGNRGVRFYSRSGAEYTDPRPRRVEAFSKLPALGRLCGATLAWLNGDARSARRSWNKAVDVAKRLGARYVLAQTNFEIGKRLISIAHLTRAESLFSDAGATFDLEQTRGLIRRMNEPKIRSVIDRRSHGASS